MAGRNVLVTGGGSGIGLAVARTLARAGGRVAIAGRRPAVLQEAATALGQPQLLHHTVDVADRSSVGRLFDWVDRELGPVHILVLAAGINVKARSMQEMKPEQWDEVLAVNATGAYNCAYAVLPQMRARGNGLIVNISSISGKRALELGGVAYCASKFALTALGTCLANEEGARGVRVTNVYPGEVDTPILEQRPQPVTAEHRARMLLPEDVAALVLAIAQLPQRAHVPEVVIKPLSQPYC